MQQLIPGFAPKAKRVIYLFMSGNQSILPLAGSHFDFQNVGNNGTRYCPTPAA